MTIPAHVNVVAFSGPAGSGKSTAAEALMECGFIRIKFADVLKDMMRAFYASAGLGTSQIEARIEGDLKEKPDFLLGNKTPRQAMQTLGTDWGRDLIHPDLWVTAWKARAMVILHGGERVVADDIRFANEAQAVRELGGAVVRLEGRSKGLSADHASERFEFEPDMTLQNTGTRQEFRGQIAYIFAYDDF